MKKQELLNVYRALWTEFQRLCSSAGVVCKPSDGSRIRLDDQACTQKDLVIKTLCYFPEWRYKAVSLRERVHIIIQSRETYSRDDDHISRSNVQVLYSTLSGNTAKSLLALHYDFVLPIQSAHPVFHAQFGAGDFPSKDLEEIGFVRQIEPPPTGTLYSSVRIPTPCMNFGSVLLGLAADHLEPAIFGQVLKLVRRSSLSGWNAVCHALQTSLKSGNYLPSHHWYQ